MTNLCVRLCVVLGVIVSLPAPAPAATVLPPLHWTCSLCDDTYPDPKGTRLAPLVDVLNGRDQEEGALSSLHSALPTQGALKDPVWLSQQAKALWPAMLPQRLFTIPARTRDTFLTFGAVTTAPPQHGGWTEVLAVAVMGLALIPMMLCTLRSAVRRAFRRPRRALGPMGYYCAPKPLTWAPVRTESGLCLTRHVLARLTVKRRRHRSDRRPFALSRLAFWSDSANQPPLWRARLFPAVEAGTS